MYHIALDQIEVYEARARGYLDRAQAFKGNRNPTMVRHCVAVARWYWQSARELARAVRSEQLVGALEYERASIHHRLIAREYRREGRPREAQRNHIDIARRHASTARALRNALAK